MLSHSTRLAIEQCNRDIRSLEQLLSETKISESQIRLDFFARKNPWERFQRLNEAATNTVLGMVGENSIQKQQFEAAFEKLLIAPRDRKDKIEDNINIAIAAIKDIIESTIVNLRSRLKDLEQNNAKDLPETQARRDHDPEIFKRIWRATEVRLKIPFTDISFDIKKFFSSK